MELWTAPVCLGPSKELWSWTTRKGEAGERGVQSCSLCQGRWCHGPASGHTTRQTAREQRQGALNAGQTPEPCHACSLIFKTSVWAMRLVPTNSAGFGFCCFVLLFPGDLVFPCLVGVM